MSDGFAIWRAARDALRVAHERAARALDAASGTERGPMGLTPDHIKARPEWRAAYAEYWRAHRALAAHNGAGMRLYRREIAQEAREARARRTAA